MEFSLNQEQMILQDTARKFLERECPVDHVREMIKDERGYSPSLWKRMAELGWLGLLFDERHGGSGGNFFDLAIILKEMGRVLLPGPFFSTVVLSGILIMESTSDEIKNRYLPEIAEGNLIMTLALSEEDGSYSLQKIQTSCKQKGDGFLITGKKMFVPDANVSRKIICPASTGATRRQRGISLFLVDGESEGVKILPLRTIDHHKQFEVILEDAYVSGDEILGRKGQGHAFIHGMLPKAISGRCCEMLGAMERIFEMTLTYIRERRQFGRPLSSFQVIQHYMADMAIDLECSKFITWQSAWSISKGLPCEKEVSMAKAWCSDQLKKMATLSHQIHGAIGFTEEHDLHLFFRCAKAWEVILGDGDFHREMVARKMIDSGGSSW